MSEGRLDLGAPNRAPAAGSGGHAIRGPQSVVTSGMPQQLFHLAYEGCWIATTIIGHAGRNPSPLIAEMEFALATPGGHNRLRCPGIMAAGTRELNSTARVRDALP